MDERQFEKKVARQALLEWKSARAPVDRVINDTLREHRVGSRQRGSIADLVYKVVRWWPTLMGPQPFEPSKIESVRRLDEALLKAQSSSFEELEVFHHKANPKFQDKPADHLRRQHGAAEFLIEEILALPDSMKSGWHDFIHQCNREATFSVRVDPSRCNLEEFIKKFSAYKPRLSEWIPDCVHFEERFLLMDTEEYKKGWVEIQDESSQLVGHLAAPKEGERVLDLCAGAGGKTLHLASLMKGRGEIQAFDILKNKLQELSVRARRASLTSVRILDQLPSKKEKFDLVLVDAPCSSLGTLRRNPDRFYRMNSEEFSRLEKIQRDLTCMGLDYLAPNGRLVYATCTVRPQENTLLISQIVQSLNRSWIPIENSLAKALGQAKADKLLALLRASPAARLTGKLPEGCLQFGPVVSQASGSFEGDGFFVSLVN